MFIFFILFRNVKVKKQDQLTPPEPLMKQEEASPSKHSDAGKENSVVVTPGSSTTVPVEPPKKSKS